jgi:5-methylcytosine-specific restriction endonuclease McrA
MQFTLSGETYNKLRQAQDLLRHVIPTGDPAAIFDRGLTLLLAEAQRTKFAATTRPRAPQEARLRSRHVPASVRREVWKRDDGRCAFIGGTGRCTERGFLEFHHVVPYADSGAATLDNVELRCRAHNTYEAERWSGGSDTLFVKEPRAQFWATRAGPRM